MQKSVTNASRSLTIKVYTTHRFMANDYLHNLSIKPTNIFSHALIHVLSLLITAYSFKAYDLIVAIHSIHAIDQFKSFTNTRFSNQTTHYIINQNCKLFNKL